MKTLNLSGRLIPITLTLTVLISTLLFSSCDENNTADNMTDEELYKMAKETVGFHWYNNSDDMGAVTQGSEHGLPYFRTRFNAEAATKLDENGRVMEGSQFPEGSLIVKELYDSNEVLAIYAVRYKVSGHADSDAEGWCWGYLNADGTVREPAVNKGAMCIDCHQQEGSIDYVLLNKVFEAAD